MIVSRLIAFHFLFLWFCHSAMTQSTVVCFELFVKEGLEAQEQLDFDLAINKFEAARICRDKPLKDDLDELLKNAKAAKIKAIIEARDQAKRSEEKVLQQLIISEGSRLTFLANQEREKGNTKSALKLAYRAMQLTGNQAPVAIQQAFGNAVYRATLKEWKGHRQSIRSAMFSPDGNLLLTCSNDSTIIIWNNSGEKIVHLQTFTNAIQSACFSPDGKTILTTSDTQVALWNLQGQKIQEFEGHKALVYEAIFSHDGQKVVTCSRDQSLGIWNVKTGERIANCRGPQAAQTKVQFSGDDKLLLSVSADKTVRIWTIQGVQKQQFEYRGLYFGGATFGPKENQLLTFTVDHTLQIWAMESGELITEIKGHQGMIREVAIAPNETGFLSGASDHLAVFWDATGQEQFRLDDHIGSVEEVRFSKDGNYILTGSKDKTAKLYDENGQLLMNLSGFSGPVNQVAFSPNHQELVIVGESPIVYLCQNPKTYYPFLQQHPPEDFTDEEREKYTILD